MTETRANYSAPNSTGAGNGKADQGSSPAGSSLAEERITATDAIIHNCGNGVNGLDASCRFSTCCNTPDWGLELGPCTNCPDHSRLIDDSEYSSTDKPIGSDLSKALGG